MQRVSNGRSVTGAAAASKATERHAKANRQFAVRGLRTAERQSTDAFRDSRCIREESACAGAPAIAAADCRPAAFLRA
jgi:hypothetical protein